MQVLWIFALISAACALDRMPLPKEKTLLATEYEWKYFDYVWQYPRQKQQYISSGKYDPKKMVPIDVDRDQAGRTFVTVIRTAGVPATLHTVSDEKGESGPLLKPYPDWAWYEESLECRGIINVYRVAIDKCNRMWILDTGKIDEKQVCQEKFFVFDLNTDRLLFWREIPYHAARNREGKGLLVTPIVETYGEKCEDTTLYMADVDGYSLVIFKDERFIRVNDDVYKPEERNANFDIAGERFYLADGVLGMALSPIQYPSQNRFLSFKPLASRSLYAADTRELRDSVYGRKINYVRGTDLLPSQASTMAFSIEGTLFYGLTHEMAIGCHNMHRPLSSQNLKIAIQDDERLQFASGMKVVSNNAFTRGEELIVMTNRLQKIYADTMNFNEINFRVMSVPVEDLIWQTACDMP